MSGLFDAQLPQSLFPLLPNVFTMTLRNKSAAGGTSEGGGEVADTYAAGQTVSVRRRPSTMDELNRANLLGADKVITLVVLKPASGSFTPPTNEATITDESSVVWTVKRVSADVLETLYTCVCVQEW